MQADRSAQPFTESSEALAADRHPIPLHSRIHLGIGELDLNQMRVEPSGDYVPLLCQIQLERRFGIGRRIFDLQLRKGGIGVVIQETPLQYIFRKRIGMLYAVKCTLPNKRKMSHQLLLSLFLAQEIVIFTGCNQKVDRPVSGTKRQCLGCYPGVIELWKYRFETQ